MELISNMEPRHPRFLWVVIGWELQVSMLTKKNDQSFYSVYYRFQLCMFK